MGDAESATGMNVMFHDSIRPRPSLHVGPLDVLWVFHCAKNLSVL